MRSFLPAAAALLLLACSGGSGEGAHHPSKHADPHPADPVHEGAASGGHGDHGAAHGGGHGADHGGDHGPDHGDARGATKPPGASGGLTLTLDDGLKWKMDDHTRASIVALRPLLQTAPPDAAAAEALSATLKTHMDELIAGCTMTGPAHDQLHVFLIAFLPKVMALAHAKDGADAAAQVETLRSLLDTYDLHFE